jgi:hypothetical protein
VTDFACTDCLEIPSAIRNGLPPEPIETPPFGIPICCVGNEIGGDAPYWTVTLLTEDGQQLILRLLNRLPLGRWMVRVRAGEEDWGWLHFMGDADSPPQLRAQIGDRIHWADIG